MEVLKTTSPVVKPGAPIEIPRNLVPSASTNTADIFRDKMILQYLRIQRFGYWIYKTGEVFNSSRFKYRRYYSRISALFQRAKER